MFVSVPKKSAAENCGDVRWSRRAPGVENRVIEPVAHTVVKGAVQSNPLHVLESVENQLQNG